MGERRTFTVLLNDSFSFFNPLSFCYQGIFRQFTQTNKPGQENVRERMERDKASDSSSQQSLLLDLSSVIASVFESVTM